MAAPVVLGIMLNEAALPPLQSLLDGPSTVFCVAERFCNPTMYSNQERIYIYYKRKMVVLLLPVMEWMVDMRPSTIPKLSLITLANGARQLVVQLALETMFTSDLYSFSFTPTTNMGASLLGAEMTTFFAPP